ncbi:MAG: ABC transporter ATP-binding protein [Spartobacteria bacterium]|nr:ABC transporter ATP-binding protein [Spartobacteria bacterium]
MFHRRHNKETGTPSDLAIDVHGVTKSFDKHVVVNHVDLQIRRGEIYGFLGPNGSGKTTFMRMLCGLLIPDAGHGTCLGHDILREQRHIRNNIGYMTQHFSYYGDLSIRENLDFMARLYNVKNRAKKVNNSIEQLGLGGRQQQLAGSLSGGWKQRLALAACMIHEPRILLLDEPTAGVDPKARRDFWDEIHRLAADGLTVLITTHYMDEAERCHRIAYLAYGNILTRGTVPDVIAAAQLVTWMVAGPSLAQLSKQLKELPGIEQVAAFGTRLHVCGTDAELMEQSLKPYHEPPYQTRRITASLEDVFIHLMIQSKDNFAP